MADLPGEAEFVAESLDHLSVRGDFGFEQLQGHFFFDVGVKDLVDFPHAALAQRLDDLVAAGEGRAGGQLMARRLDGFRDFGTDRL
jgi:hypothetical protein